MTDYIDRVNFKELEPMKYYAPPASWSQEKRRENAHSKIFSGEWLGSTKFDGYFAKLVKDEDGNVGLYSRSRNVNGEFPEKHEWVPHLQPFFEQLPNGTCLLGELYLPSSPGSKNITSIMGCLKEKAIDRQNKGEKLHFYVFDVLAIGGQSVLDMPAAHRFSLIETIHMSICDSDYISFATYYTGKELWSMLQEILARGDEGIVITHKDGKYEPGKRPSKTTLKIKKELKQTIDCFFTGRGSAPTKEYTGKEIETWQYWQDSITGEKRQGELFKDYKAGATIEPVTKGYYNGWYGSLEIGVLRHKTGSKCKIRGEIFEDTEVYPIGWLSGVTDEMKADPEKFAFIPMEVTAMEYDSYNHTLRHGKMVGWRKDLTLKDCSFDKID